MHVLMINNFFYPYLGGVEFHILNLSKVLIENGCKVSLLCYSDTKRNKREVFEEIEIIKVTNIFQMIKILFLNRNKYDLVHAHMSRKFFSAFGLIISKIIGYKTVFTPHCFYPSNNISKKIKKFFFDISIGKLSFLCTDVMINLTVNDQENAKKLGLRVRKSVIIPNSIRVDSFSDVKEEWAYKDKYDRLFPYLLYVGRIDWVKNLEFVVECLPHLNSVSRFVIIGQDDGYKKKLENLVQKLDIKNKVFFMGKVSYKELICAYKCCWSAVLSSRYEGLPTFALEAMVLQKCVIATNTGGTRYLIEHNKDGFLFEYNNKENFITIVNSIDRETLTKIGRNAYEKVRKFYDWKINGVKVLEIYNNLVIK